MIIKTSNLRKTHSSSKTFEISRSSELCQIIESFLPTVEPESSKKNQCQIVATNKHQLCPSPVPAPKKLPKKKKKLNRNETPAPMTHKTPPNLPS